MSDADPGAVTVSEAGVTVNKYVDTEEFDALAVVFELEFETEDAVSVSLNDPIPEGIPAEDVGIHPEYGGEYWTIQEDVVRFERHFEDEPSYTTLYGVRTDEDDIERFAVAPTLSVTAEADRDAPDDDAAEDPLGTEAPDVTAAEDILGESDKYGSVESSDIVREVISGERDSVPGMEAASADDDSAVEPTDPTDSHSDPLGADDDTTEDVETADDDLLGDAVMDDSTADDDLQPETAPSPESDPTDIATGESTADAVSEEDVDEDAGDESPLDETTTPTDMTEDEPMEEPSTTEEQAPGATTTADADADADTDTDADADAMSPDDDTEGAAEDREMITVPATGGVARLLVKELQEGHVDEKWRRQLRDALGVSGSTESGSVEARIQHLQTEVSDLAAYTDALEEFLDENGAGRDLIESIEDDLATMDSTIDRLENRLDQGEDELTDIGDSVSTIEDDLEELRSELESQADLRDEVDDLSAEVAAMNDDIEEIKQFHERMSAVFNQQTPDE